MKDRVFIAWSGSANVAACVKRILEEEYSYICVVGGNSDNDSERASISDTVIQQIRSCNQSIVIFQNKETGEISRNLFFELGYSYALYGAKKVHCVKRKEDDISLPSNFGNAFVEPIPCELADESFAKGIVEYFMSRQKMSVNENKMFLIDNRYMIHEKIASHYSEAGSKCSDYELAQYLLYYVQAAFMFDDIPRVHKEILQFKREHAFIFSQELEISVNLILAYCELLFNIKEYNESHDVYVDEDALFEFKRIYTNCSKLVKDDDLGVFDEWAKMFISQHLNFAYMLLGNNISLEPEIRVSAYRKSIKHAEEAMENIRILEEMKSSRENHDDRGLLTLLKAYVTRNLYICKKYVGDEDAVLWLKESVEEREYLKNNYGNGTIDSKIYNNFCMEYYLALMSYIDEAGEEEIDEFDITMYKKRMREYLQQVEKSSRKTSYLQKIRVWVEKE